MYDETYESPVLFGADNDFFAKGANDSGEGSSHGGTDDE